jgi:Transposase
MSQRRKAWSKWRKLVSQQGKSGRSVAAFCRQRGLCAPHFFAWKKRLNQAVEASPAKDTAIEILLPQDRRLRVRPGFDAQHLQEVLAVLEKRS